MVKMEAKTTQDIFNDIMSEELKQDVKFVRVDDVYNYVINHPQWNISRDDRDYKEIVTDILDELLSNLSQSTLIEEQSRGKK